MTTEQMMATLESYYGEPYAGIHAQLVRKHLERLDNRTRAALFQVLVRRVSRAYGKSPDVEAIESNLGEARDMLPTATALPEYVSPEDRAQVARLMEQAKDTPHGRMLLGIMGEGS